MLEGQWNWGVFDYVFMAALLLGLGGSLRFAWKKIPNRRHRGWACAGLVAFFFLIWMELAVQGVSKALRYAF